MVRTTLLLALLGLLAAAPAPATAHPAGTRWWFWFSKPEHHGSRKMAGDFTPVYTTYRNHSRERAPHRTMAGDFEPVTASYRYHSRERRGLFSFLRRRRPGTSTARRHRKGRTPRSAGSRKSHMTI